MRWDSHSCSEKFQGILINTLKESPLTSNAWKIHPHSQEINRDFISEGAPILRVWYNVYSFRKNLNRQFSRFLEDIIGKILRLIKNACQVFSYYDIRAAMNKIDKKGMSAIRARFIIML